MLWNQPVGLAHYLRIAALIDGLKQLFPNFFPSTINKQQ